jgi:hypothetical protein
MRPNAGGAHEPHELEPRRRRLREARELGPGGGGDDAS